MRRSAGKAVLAMALAVLPRGAVAADIAATVRGAVARPGTYALAPGDRLSTLVEKAGGFTDAAFLRGAVLTRRDVANAERDELRAIAGRLAAEMPVPDDPRARDDRARFLAAVSALPAAGRVPVRLSHPRLMKGTADDIPLADGDVLTVPVDPGTVAVTGAVGSPGEFPAREGAGWRDYVRAAGGAARDADLGKAWLLAADGTAAPLARPAVAWNPVAGRWEFTAFRPDPAPARAGDTIVVPRRAGRIAWLRGIRDIDALLVRIAIITGQAVAP
ncbi:MAG: SLBB domain-containing protein [Gemmatimonadota bacterium]